MYWEGGKSTRYLHVHADNTSSFSLLQLHVHTDELPVADLACYTFRYCVHVLIIQCPFYVYVHVHAGENRAMSQSVSRKGI